MKSKNLLSTLVLGLFALSVAGGCSKKSGSDETSKTTETAPTARVLQIHTWSNYISPAVIEAFEKKTGAKVSLNFFSSNEELLAKLQAGARGYDIIMPSSYMIQALKELNLIQPLGSLDWPELAKLSKRFQNPSFDPKHEFTIPFAWGTTGIAVNRAKIKNAIDSWDWIFAHPELKGQVTMLDDAPAVVGAALKYLGYPYNEASPEAFAKVKALLMKQKKWLKAYSAEVLPLLESGEVALAQAYSGDVLQARRKNPNIEYVLPKEGAELFVDTMAIPVGAPVPELAKEFMRFTLQIENAATQVKHLFYSPVVDLTGVAGTEELLKNPAINPTPELDKRLEIMIESAERSEAIQRLWTELKSS
ncbi:MAG TPA: spermidine/putrescine ABC transporter substrate-binding protein [Oligoflexia bacterium]|nr:spermidine/putrescine ABC transporter substrate-binding protein [Oligoflexia bacterium]